MRNLSFAGTSFFGLLRNLKMDVKMFIRSELALARSEMLEKMSRYGRNATTLVIGGVVAYAGLIVLLCGIGLLIGYAFRKLGLDAVLAASIGFGVIALLVIITGTAMILKGIKAISSEPLAPQRTLDTLMHINSNEPAKAHKEHKPAPRKRSPDELQQEALATEDRIGQELEEIAYRASPGRIKRKSSEHIRTHPYTWSSFALATGLIGSLLIGRKFRRT